MATELITPDQVPTWVPGRLTVCNSEHGWDGLTVRGYQYGRLDVAAPPLRDFVVIAYRRGTTAMRRKVDGRWQDETVRPGAVSLLTRGAVSEWMWSDPIEVVHVYLSRDELTATCREMYARDVVDIELHDELRTDDPALYRTVMAIADEAARGGPGSKLLVDSLSTQLCVHILRAHADMLFREPPGQGGLTLAQERIVRDYVQAHLAEPISLRDLAGALALSRHHFAHSFRKCTGTTPHEFVLRQRVERAKTLLSRTSTPLPEVAAHCGFADQSHLTRVFKQRAGTTPANYRTRQ